MLNIGNDVFANEQFPAREGDQLATHAQLTDRVRSPFVRRQLGGGAAVGCVVAMHASEVAAIRQLHVHLLDVVMLPVELVNFSSTLVASPDSNFGVIQLPGPGAERWETAAN